MSEEKTFKYVLLPKDYMNGGQWNNLTNWRCPMPPWMIYVEEDAKNPKMWALSNNYGHIYLASKYISDNFKGQYPLDLNDIFYVNIIRCYAVQHAIEFSDKKHINAVECGVCEGISAFYELSELNHHNIGSYHFHLYDSWDVIREEDTIYQKEKKNIGNYSKLNIETTKKNLNKYNDHITYHKGYIPDTFDDTAPDNVSFMHIDLNCAKPTVDALEFFYPRMTKYGVILFDDYGSRKYVDTKRLVDEFFESKPGIMLEVHTGQSMYFCNK